MKKLLINTMAIFTACALSANASAETVQPVHTQPIMRQSATLTELNFQAGTYLDQLDISSAEVILDYAKYEIDLLLTQDFYCPPNALCAQVMPEVLLFRVPLLTKKIGSCGEYIYSGYVDQMRVDGPRTEITVIDNTPVFCRTLIALPPTVVQLKIDARTFSNVDRHQVHEFSGSKLTPSYRR